MTVTATVVGRELHLSIEGLEPFVVKPLPGLAGMQMTEQYLHASAPGTPARAKDLTEALMMAVDGAREVDGRWVPLFADEQINYARIGRELSLGEAESILLPAFFWQTVLKIEGVRVYIEGGEGLAGAVKALGALTSRLGLWASTTSPRTESESQSTASIPSTSSRPNGGKPGKQPQDRRTPTPKPKKG